MIFRSSFLTTQKILNKENCIRKLITFEKFNCCFMKRELIILLIGVFLLISCDRDKVDYQETTEVEVELIESVSDSSSDSELFLHDVRPIASIGTEIDEGGVDRNVILANPLITARSSKDFDYDLQWKVICYKVAFDEGEGTPLSYILVDTPRFPENVISAIRKAKSGTRMVISDIKVRSNVSERYAPDFSVIIK